MNFLSASFPSPPPPRGRDIANVIWMFLRSCAGSKQNSPRVQRCEATLLTLTVNHLGQLSWTESPCRRLSAQRPHPGESSPESLVPKAQKRYHGSPPVSQCTAQQSQLLQAHHVLLLPRSDTHHRADAFFLRIPA